MKAHPGKQGMLQIHASSLHISKVLAPQQPCCGSQPFILLCVFHFDEEQGHELQPTVHTFLRPTGCRPGKFGKAVDELPCEETGDPSIQEQCESTVHSGEGAASIPGTERKVRNNHSTLSTKYFYVSHEIGFCLHLLPLQSRLETSF